MCPRCRGQMMSRYGEDECLQCGFQRNIILSPDEKGRQLLELAYMTDDEFEVDYGDVAEESGG